MASITSIGFFEDGQYQQTNASSSQKFKINPTRTTPYVFFDKTNGVLWLKGKSSPDNARVFYEQITSSIYDFLSAGKSSLVVNINLQYFNTSSAKCLFNLLNLLKAAKSRGVEIKVNWHYEENDEDMLECGEDYGEVLDMKFNYIITK